MDVVRASLAGFELRFRDAEARAAAWDALIDERSRRDASFDGADAIRWTDPKTFRMAIDELDGRGWRIRFGREERLAWVRSLDTAPYATTLYRGERALRQTGYASDPGDLGTGRYLTTHRKTAALYGPVGAHRVAYERTARGDTREILRFVDFFYRTCKGKDRVGGADLMRADFLECGIEALLIDGYDSPEGHLTVVEFSSTPPRPVKPWDEPDWEPVAEAVPAP